MLKELLKEMFSRQARVIMAPWQNANKGFKGFRRQRRITVKLHVDCAAPFRNAKQLCVSTSFP
jgi:hypothetical protein